MRTERAGWLAVIEVEGCDRHRSQEVGCRVSSLDAQMRMNDLSGVSGNSDHNIEKISSLARAFPSMGTLAQRSMRLVLNLELELAPIG
jgi:hypothetical protein